MKRTIDMMTAARAKGVDLPGEWFYSSPRCPRCNSSETEHGRNGWKCTDLECGFPFEADGCIWTHDPSECPDLTLPENLHDAFRFADALFCQVDTYTENSKSDRLVPLSRAVCWHKDGKVFNRTAPERHLALVAACEAALGIQHGKEIA